MPVDFALPDLSGEYDLSLGVCGQLTTDEPDVIKKLSLLNNKRLYAERAGNQRVFLRAFSLGSGGEKHIHIDINTSRSFQKEPKPNSTLEEVFSFLEGFLEQPLRVNLAGRFVVPKDKLPEKGLIRTSMLQVKIGEIAIEQTAATFSFNDGPIRRIEWSRPQKSDLIEVTVDLMVSTKIDSTYLVKLYEKAATVFRTAILGETADTTTEAAS